MPVRHGNATGLRGHSHHHKGGSGKTGRGERLVPVLAESGARSWSVFSPSGFPHLEQKLILFGTAAWSHTHKQGLEGLHLLPEAWERRLARDSTSTFKAPVEHGRSRGGRLELTNIPHGCQGHWGWINWKPRHFLILRDPAKSFSTGVITPWYKQRGSWHLVAGRVPVRATQESRARSGQCQWATGDSSFCRRRRRSSAASGSPSSGSSSAVPTDSEAEGFSASGIGGEAPRDGVGASELGTLVEGVADTTVEAVSSVGFTEVAGLGGPREASTVRYWLICSMAASSSVCMLRRLCSRASRCCRSWPSSARSSSGVRPAKPAGGTGIGGKAKGGGRGIPIQGGGKGKPGAGPVSGPGTEPDAGAEVLVPAAVVVAAPLGREGAALVDGGAAASPELGGGGTGGKGPIGGHSGNMPGGKGGRRPWGKLGGCGSSGGG